MHNQFNTLSELTTQSGKSYKYYSLPKLAAAGFNLKKLPVSIRIVLLKQCCVTDNVKITEAHIQQLASWGAKAVELMKFLFICCPCSFARFYWCSIIV